jgi:hypothetical protein
MVSLEVRGIVSTKDDPKILWEKKLEIIEIINVSGWNCCGAHNSTL